MKEVQTKPPQEEITDLSLEALASVSEQDKKQQQDYDRRHKGFMEAFQKLEKKFKIKLLQTPARIIYSDTKEYEKTKKSQ